MNTTIFVIDDDNHTHIAAAWTMFRAFLFTTWQTAAAAALSTVVVGEALYILDVSLPANALALLVYLLLAWPSITAGLAVWVVLSTRARDRRLCYLQRPGGSSTLILMDINDHDVRADAFASWPPRQGVGRELGEQVRDHIHHEGRRIVAICWRPLAQAYKKHGMIETHRSFFGLRVHLTSRVSPGQTPKQ